MGPIYSLDDVIDMLRRRAVLIGAVTGLGALFFVIYALMTPHLYQSVEVIQVETPLIADEMAPTVVDSSSGRRLQSVQHQLTSRNTLLDIIEQYGLFEDRRALTLSEKAQLLREMIQWEGVDAAPEGDIEDGEISVLTIAVRLETPELSQLVAREVSQRTIELYATRRIEEATTSVQFFTDEQNELFRELQELEDRMAAYRAGQDLSVEGSIEFRRLQMDAINSTILEIERDQIAAQRELDQIEDNPRLPGTLQREIRELETELMNLAEQRALLEARLADLTAALETSPEVERQLGVFERERELIREQLDIVSTRRAEAEVALRLETERKSERLVVLEQADLPIDPVTASRKRTVLLGTAASMIFGIFIAFVLELRRPIIRTAKQMEREIGIVPVVTLPNVSVSRTEPELLDRVKAWFNGQVPITPPAKQSRNMRES